MRMYRRVVRRAGGGGRSTLVTFGGGTCSPSCVCKSDTWAVNTAKRAVEQVAGVPAGAPYPLERYRHTVSGVEVQPLGPGGDPTQVVVLFGGERYNPSTYVSLPLRCVGAPSWLP
jgi:hypothetical protein